MLLCSYPYPFIQSNVTPIATSATIKVTTMMTPIAVLRVIRFSLGEQSPLSPLIANHVATEHGSSHATRSTIIPLVSILLRKQGVKVVELLLGNLLEVGWVVIVASKTLAQSLYLHTIIESVDQLSR